MSTTLQKLNPNILVFTLFLGLFFIQRIFFDLIQDSTIAFAASFLYLPHGLRVLATLIGGRKIILGLFLGHIFSGIYMHLSASICINYIYIYSTSIEYYHTTRTHTRMQMQIQTHIPWCHVD